MLEKFIKITEKDKTITIHFLFIKIKFSKDKLLNRFVNNQHQNMEEYVKKYRYVLKTNIELETMKGFEKTIWTCWFQGVENAPPIVKTAMKTHSVYNPGHPVIVITENNLNQYVKIPQHIMKKYKNGIISRTHFSDYLRLCLLQKYGGTWVDATCYFTDRIPENIWNSSFFQFKNHSWYVLKEIPKNDEIWNLIRRYANPSNFSQTGSNWFLHAKPNNPIILRTKQLLEEYWKEENTLINFFIFHYLLTFAVKNDEACKKEFENSPNYINIYPFLLQMAYYDKFDEKLYQEIIKKSFVHKLRNRDLKPSDKYDFFTFLSNKN